MKVGDLVMSAEFGGCDGEGLGIVLETARLGYDCLGRLGPANETYCIVKVLFPAGIIDVFEKDIEVM
tara:strand:+ start:3047 stop:3247 length:201 start_codon:yes stop_codon:yes gene_type:complete